MVEYTGREGMHIKLEDTSREISIEDSYAGKYNFVVDCYNETCERPCEKLEHLPANCCLKSACFPRCLDSPYGLRFALCAFLSMGLAFPICLFMWLDNLPAMLTYRRNKKKVPNLLGRFIYCPELCGDYPNKHYSLSLRYYKAGILSFNGQDMHVDAASIKVVGDKISFMVYNEILSGYAADVGLQYILYTVCLIASGILFAVVTLLLLFYRE